MKFERKMKTSSNQDKRGAAGGINLKTHKPVNKLKYLSKESPMPSKTEKRHQQKLSLNH